MFSSKLLQDHLSTDFLGCNIIYQPQTNSTNEDAWNYYSNGSPNGTLIITHNQQKGCGRRQNKWFSTSGKSLTISFILHSEIGLEKLGLLPLLTGVSIVQGIRRTTSIQTGLKWPNDIFLNGVKMGGILIESRSIKNGLGVVIGIGLNINESNTDFPKELHEEATSLGIHSGEQYKCELILASILNEFEQLYIQQWNTIIPIWRKYCIHQDSEVTFYTENGLHHGIFQGISSHGHAEIEINGETQTFPAGMVVL